MSEGPTATPTPTGTPPYRYRGVAGCGCPRCRIRGLRTPLILITLGGLFLLDHTFHQIRFGHLWPVILIVIGIVMLLESTASTEGHRG